MPEVLTEVEPEAICIECKLPFTFDDSRSHGTRDTVLYCSPECEAGLKIEARRRRLEREVIARAKEFTDDKEPRDNWDALVAYRELCRAVDALIDFESQIKK